MPFRRRSAAEPVKVTPVLVQAGHAVYRGGSAHPWRAGDTVMLPEEHAKAIADAFPSKSASPASAAGALSGGSAAPAPADDAASAGKGNGKKAAS
jgi:hypothetical protein